MPRRRIYLNALPYLFDWLRYGKGRSFLKASVLFTAAAAAHHATLLFGSMFFALPVRGAGAAGPRGRRGDFAAGAGGAHRHNRSWWLPSRLPSCCCRSGSALIRYPVTQTPIPHPSRANYILSPQWGLNYFVVPYGALILALPFILMRGSHGRPAASFAAGILGRLSGGSGRNNSRWASGFWAAPSKC